MANTTRIPRSRPNPLPASNNSSTNVLGPEPEPVRQLTPTKIVEPSRLRKPFAIPVLGTGIRKPSISAATGLLGRAKSKSAVPVLKTPAETEEEDELVDPAEASEHDQVESIVSASDVSSTFQQQESASEPALVTAPPAGVGATAAAKQLMAPTGVCMPGSRLPRSNSTSSGLRPPRSIGRTRPARSVRVPSSKDLASMSRPSTPTPEPSSPGLTAALPETPAAMSQDVGPSEGPETPALATLIRQSHNVADSEGNASPTLGEVGDISIASSASFARLTPPKVTIPRLNFLEGMTSSFGFSSVSRRDGPRTRAAAAAEAAAAATGLDDPSASMDFSPSKLQTPHRKPRSKGKRLGSLSGFSGIPRSLRSRRTLVEVEVTEHDGAAPEDGVPVEVVDDDEFDAAEASLQLLELSPLGTSLRRPNKSRSRLGMYPQVSPLVFTPSDAPADESDGGPTSATATAPATAMILSSPVPDSPSPAARSELPEAAPEAESMVDPAPEGEQQPLAELDDPQAESEVPPVPEEAELQPPSQSEQPELPSQTKLEAQSAPRRPARTRPSAHAPPQAQRGPPKHTQPTQAQSPNTSAVQLSPNVRPKRLRPTPGSPSPARPRTHSGGATHVLSPLPSRTQLQAANAALEARLAALAAEESRVRALAITAARDRDAAQLALEEAKNQQSVAAWEAVVRAADEAIEEEKGWLSVLEGMRAMVAAL